MHHMVSVAVQSTHDNKIYLDKHVVHVSELIWEKNPLLMYYTNFKAHVKINIHATGNDN